MQILIRFADTTDAELIVDLSRKTFYETFVSHNTKENMDKFMTDQFSKEDLMKEVGFKDNIFLLAFDRETAVGYVKLRESPVSDELGEVNAIEIARIYASTNAIGKGVGKALMQKCIDIAVEKKKDIIWLGVWEHNQRAIDFYIKWGFEKFGTHVFLLGEDPQTDWLMKKKLTTDY